MAVQLRSSSSLSSASSTGSWRHDVFLSFRGEDTRDNFTDHLHSNLVRRGINTFIDDDLPRGEEISEALVRAIEGSKLSLIVFSKNYASSKWCLEELVRILECKRSKNQMVRAIFYKVDPSDVRHQRGTFGEALAKHERRFQDDRTNKVLRWRKALSEAADLSGWPFSGGSESNFIYGIIEEISAKLIKQTPLNVAKSPVGIESRVQDMLKLLAVGGSDIMVGIWGTGGIGKTTIAKAVYNLIANEFEDSCFLANVREHSVSHEGLVNLQNSLLFEIFGGELKVTNADQGITLLSERLRYKRILLVLDDVDQLDQLERLAGGPDWFHSGSRVIITTRDKHLLIAHQVNKNKIYKARRLDHDEARELFCANALMTYRDLDNDEKLAVNTVVKYAEGLPLALKVLGKHLCDRPIHQWQAFLDGHRRSPLQGIQNILKISYDSLEEPEKEIFLDIACFFKYKNKNDLIAILEGCGYSNPMFSIEVLEEKALLNVEHAYIFMHDLLEEMGKKIVHEESPKEAGQRSRLWHHSDVLQVLTKNTGSETIEGIMVNMPTADMIRLSRKCFKKMRKLKIFINVNGRFCGRVDYLPDQLRILDWPGCPLQSLPSKFNMKNLVQLIMSGSPIPCLGEGFKRIRNLKSLNLKKSEFLEQIPDLSGSPNLEFLDLSFCTSLKKIHPSVGYLEKLVELDLEECSKLEMLPGEVNWRSLRHINLNSCRRLESFPEIVGEMKYMTSLALSRTGIKALPSSIGHLINLEELSLHSCGNLTDLPYSIYELQNLKEVRLSWCRKLVTFPNKVDSERSKVKRKHLECSDNRDSLSKKNKTE
ncbi:putative TIR domain, P-loop containing nucleoside triphosphate hydrolase [Rosa chinensis]|uniref:Putative TIR domain, P-loop containing nucleoside triphosphate hydrolase n=1 Tax=Rosa chinensis TaxID=74649 RepID=A0A2P6PNF4_ROSCH|nr:disease resistance protein RPV1 [Rosa chinensis]PRQ23473.1 putative TIR domain, P-loop containing nucleoside triphosphate hydrolase [Rosa chinensis]